MVEIGGAKLFLGDCREILPTLGKVSAVVTDPPYGLADRWQGGTWGANPMYADARRWDQKLDQSTIDMVISAGEFVVIWGGNYYLMPPSRCWLSWIKAQQMETMADFELAWTNIDAPSKQFTEIRNPDGQREHPTQKPVSIMKWSILRCPSHALVLDPFMGSGTTGVAAAKMGLGFIGIELEEKYFDIACRRIEAAWKEPDLFVVRPPEPEQETLL